MCNSILNNIKVTIWLTSLRNLGIISISATGCKTSNNDDYDKTD